MEDIIAYILGGGGITILLGFGYQICTLSKELLIKDVQIQTGNRKLDSIVNAARTEAKATDYYVRSMADGTLTIEEGAQFKNYAAEAIVSHLTLLESLTGKPIYNRSDVPLPLPVGGKRPEQQTQSVSQPGA